MLIPVILSGGLGTRLWPISNRFVPKPFITMPDGKRLIDQTYTRAMSLGAKHVVTFTNRKLEFITQDAIKSVKKEDGTVFHLVMENVVKNTAPVFITAAKYIKKHIAPDAVMIVMPSDHLITNTAAFKECVERAAENARHGNLLTFGALPAYPETNYGYIKTGGSVNKANTVLKADGFTEKPDLQTSRQYIEQGNYFWNMGIFCFHVDTLIEQYEIHCPEMPDIADRSIAVNPEEDSTPGLQKYTLHSAFESFREISVDYAIMEKAENINMVKAEFDWRDMGSWTMMRETVPKDKDDNNLTGNNLLINSKDSFVWNTQKPLALIGLSNVSVIDTFEGTLVYNNAEAGKIKAAYEKFEIQQKSDCRQRIIYELGHTTVSVIELQQNKSIEYTAGQILTQFRVISGKASVENKPGETKIFTSGKPFDLEPGKQVNITNIGKDTLVIIKVETQG